MGASLSTLACNGIGPLYLSYQCFRALKYNADPTEQIELLICWIIVVSFIVITQVVFDPLLAFWLPFYHLAKIAFTAWLVAPPTKGAFYMYRRHVVPFFDAVEAEVTTKVKAWQQLTDAAS